MRNVTDFTSIVQTEWTELDELAAREGAAAARLYRRTGARSCDASEFTYYMLPDDQRGTHYNRRAAVDAFERLFKGEKPARRRELTCINTDRQRQYRARLRAALARTAA